MIDNLKELPRVSDSISFIFLEYARIEQDNFSIKAVREGSEVSLPITSFCTIFLGPGTSITHQAVKICAEAGVLLIWGSSNGFYFYAGGCNYTKSNANLLKQVNYYSDIDKHLSIVREMYNLRFPNLDMSNMDLAKMRGVEGSRVRTVYSTLSKSYGVAWQNRDTGRGNWDSLDKINKAITYSNSILYGVVHSVIYSLGFNPSLGFIHTGPNLSFVYDIADLYKMETSVLVSFKVVSQLKDNTSESELLKVIKRELYFLLGEKKILKKMVKDILFLFDEPNKDIKIITENGLWDIDKIVKGNNNYGGV